MDVDVNYLAVLLSVVATMVIGYLWYSPMLFGKTWSELTGITQENMKADAPKAIPVALVCAALKAYMLAHIVFLAHEYFQDSFMQNALTTAFFVWLGFVATQTVARNAYERTNPKLTFIAIGYDFVVFAAMGLIIGGLGV